MNAVKSVINPNTMQGQVTWLTVSGPREFPNGYPSEDGLGTVHFAGRVFTVLPFQGLTVHDLLMCGRQIRRSVSVEIDLPMPDHPWNNDSLLLSGPRYYNQLGQENPIRHHLYVDWTKRDGTQLPAVDMGLAQPWYAAFSQGAQGIMIGREFVGGQLKTIVSVINYILIRHSHNTEQKLCFSVARAVLDGKTIKGRAQMLPRRTLQVIRKFEQCCTPTDRGTNESYWDTYKSDALRQFTIDTANCTDWVAASEHIHTPWDILHYVKVWKLGAKEEPLTIRIDRA